MAEASVNVQVEGRSLRLSHLDKVLYPETGTTKAELIDYYARIAPALLPHVVGRPVTRKRWPDGVGTAAAPQEPFFAKHLEPGAPSWIPRSGIDHSTGTKDYPLVTDAATLVYFAQSASLELHVPQWRFDAQGQPAFPDRLVLDLDPGEGAGLAQCAEVAFLARDLLRGMGLEPFALTSGGSGIHLYAHLDGTASSEQTSAVAKALARALEQDRPDLVVSGMAKAARVGRVLIDWSQNNGKKTTIAPYSLRGRLRPTVAAPRTWEELGSVDLRQLEFTEVLDRVAEDGDLLAALDPAPGLLAAYLAKRTRPTPEPLPASSDALPTDRRRFVIQEHHASHLHYDLRLERDGVLVSWAVPKGLPESSEQNVLAVQTENHPISYLGFAGTIPAGAYGAGTMSIWDTGTYELEKWRPDEIIVTLRGSGPASDVRIALLRTEGSGEKSKWLLHRTRSAVQTVKYAPQPAPTGFTAPMLAVGSTAPLAVAAARRWGSWVEFKWDGVRVIGVWSQSRLRLFSRTGGDITARYPEIAAEGSARFGAADAIVDGEIVALDANGRPDFPRLQDRMHLTKAFEIEREAARTPVSYFLFDALHADEDLTSRPLHERRRALERIAADAGPAIIVPPVFDDVLATLDTASDRSLEGIMVKDPASPYRPGVRSESWLKVKLTSTQDVVIGGVRPGKGNRTGAIGSLLMGVWQSDGTLHYAGRVGTGFSEEAAAALLRRLVPLGIAEPAFSDVPAADASDAIWVRPELVGEVEFADWSPNGHLRHARWRGLRADIDPSSVVRET
ncbi:non-homologous end-joining DNA ligase [Microbacterium gorillae]|uniref:non-homologous end-joining DNA ligase n=1 Tax=Microbacterium gorillae TaxID=1231063 RepID=UPI003D9994E9